MSYWDRAITGKHGGSSIEMEEVIANKVKADVRSGQIIAELDEISLRHLHSYPERLKPLEEE